MRVAIVHDWLTNLGGAERLVLELLELYPEADLYTSVYSERSLKLFAGREVKTTFLQHWPLATRHQLYPVLRRLAFESLDLSSYDLVISSTSAEAKGIITGEQTVHICYMNTPTRYYWSHYKEYLESPGFGWLNPLIRFVLRSTIGSSRRWDYAAAQRPDMILANSHNVQNRIQKYYQRDSEVVYPAVDTIRFQTSMPRPTGAPESYLLVVSRLIPYKRIDIAVAAAQAAGRELVVIGEGSQLESLRELGGDRAHFLGALPDNEVVAYMQHAQALLFPGLEDFGITPVEAMAAGIPVIAFDAGGAAETTKHEETGLLVSQQNVRAFAVAIRRLESLSLSKTAIQKQAERFSVAHFHAGIKAAVVQAFHAGK